MKNKMLGHLVVWLLAIGLLPSARPFTGGTSTTCSSGVWYLGYTLVDSYAYWNYTSADLSYISANGNHWNANYAVNVYDDYFGYIGFDRSKILGASDTDTYGFDYCSPAQSGWGVAELYTNDFATTLWGNPSYYN